MQSSRTPRWCLAVFGLFVALAMVITDADARRLGGGRSIGRQSNQVTQREAPASQPAPHQSAANPAQGAQPPAAPAPQPNRNRWLGPLAGIAAGLGIAALLSHFGLGAGLAEMLGPLLLIGLLVIGVMFVFRMLRGANAGGGARPAYAGGPAPLQRDPLPAARGDDTPVPLRPQVASPGQPVSVTGEPLRPIGTPPAGGWSIPPGFDVAGFERNAKVHFIRLQAAWDAGDLADIREFTTPEMFAEIKVDLSERGSAPNQTEVVAVEAKLLGIEQLDGLAMASVRFTGTLREAPAAAATPLSEVWNLVKPLTGRDGWLLAGIQQEDGAVH